MFSPMITALVAATMLMHPTAPAAPVNEDDPSWSCITDGNRVCGPSNDQHATPGCYDDTATLVAPWPCHVVVDPATGEADVYTGALR